MAEKEIKQAYMDMFLEHFVYSVEELEKQGETPEQRKKNLINILKAFKYLIEDTDRLSMGDVIKVGNMVNEGYDIPEGLRKTVVTAGNKANWEPAEPYRIPQDLMHLLNDYYYMWEGLDPYLRESMFHIKYMHLHPFEDGNKRSGKLIMASNMWKNGITPAVITNADTDIYYELLNNMDYDRFALFLKQRSVNETSIMCAFYKQRKGLGLIDEVDDEKVKKLILK